MVLSMISQFQSKKPKVATSAWIAKRSDVIGDVQIDDDASVFFQCVIRGDKDKIIIKEKTNIQDGCILHSDQGHTLCIEEGVSVGHGCILHGCHIGKECLIGMGSILLNDVEIGEHCIIGAGTLLLEGTKIPANSVVVGSPGVVVKSITEKQIQDIIHNRDTYRELAQQYKEMED